MASDIIQALKSRLSDSIKGLRVVDEGLMALMDLRFGELPLRLEHDASADSLRVMVRFAHPPGAGPDFLVFCLALNTQYWDVKIGIEEDGHFVVHSDLDVAEDSDIEELASLITDRIETIADMLDDDLVGWLLPKQLGTPQQIERWLVRAPK